MAMAAENLALVNEINGETESWKVKVMIIRLWKQTFSNNPEVVASIEMVLIDEQGTRIQGTVKRNLIGQFDALLQEGGVRVLSKFGVAENKARDFDSTYSFDAIGEVIHCEDTRVMNTKGKERRVKSLQLQNEEGTKMKCALWDEHASKLDAFLADPERNDARVIMLLQFAKFGEWENEPQISNSLFGSKVLINEDLPAFAEFKERLLTVHVEPTVDRNLSSTTVYSNPIDYWQRVEIKNIDELMDIKQPTGCIVVGTIIRIQTEYDWFYHACNKCSKKVERLYQLVDENTDDEGVARFECGECGVITDVYPKIKLQVRVQDATGSISFVIFERDVTGFVHKPTSQLISNANKVEHFEFFPAEFNMFIGKRFAFKIKVSTYNIEAKYYVYTVNKLSDEESVIDAILKRAHGDEESDVDPQAIKELPSLPGPSAKDAVSSTGETVTPVDNMKSTASSPGSKKVVQDDDGDLVITGSSSKGPPDVHKMKIPKLEKF